MIDKLEMFIALANERHFGRAAEAVGVTQPTLSSAIRQLEEQLGVQLVFRGSRFEGLTPEGARVLEWALRIVADTRTLREEMRARRQGLSGTLRIGIIPTALPMIARLTVPFLAAHPNTDLTLLSRTSVEILDGIERLELDAGITYLDNEPLGRVVQVPLYRERYRLLVAASSPVAARTEIGWAEVATLPLCLLTGDMQNRRIVNRNLAEAGAVVRARVEANSSVALIAHVKTGHWVAIVAETLAEMHGAGLRAIPIVAPDASHLVGLIAAPREPHRPVLNALLDQARKAARL